MKRIWLPWFPNHTIGERIALAFLVPAVAGLLVLLGVICREADFPTSLWFSTFGIVTSAMGLGGVGASWAVKRVLIDVHTRWVDAVGSGLTVAGALLTFAGFWWSAKRPPENWDLDTMPTVGFLSVIFVLSALSALLLFMVAGTRSQETSARPDFDGTASQAGTVIAPRL